MTFHSRIPHRIDGCLRHSTQTEASHQPKQRAKTAGDRGIAMER